VADTGLVGRTEDDVDRVGAGRVCEHVGGDALVAGVGEQLEFGVVSPEPLALQRLREK
jgi:hypothetical protein